MNFTLFFLYIKGKQVGASVSRDNFEVLILKGKILLLQVNGSHLHGNCIFYTVHCTLYIVGICESGISNKKRRKVYLLEKYETSTCINSITSNSYISINGRFTVLEVISVM